jgi:hypothetical protein
MQSVKVIKPISRWKLLQRGHNGQTSNIQAILDAEKWNDFCWWFSILYLNFDWITHHEFFLHRLNMNHSICTDAVQHLQKKKCNEKVLKNRAHKTGFSSLTTLLLTTLLCLCRNFWSIKSEWLLSSASHIPHSELCHFFLFPKIKLILKGRDMMLSSQPKKHHRLNL